MQTHRQPGVGRHGRGLGAGIGDAAAAARRGLPAAGRRRRCSARPAWCGASRAPPGGAALRRPMCGSLQAAATIAPPVHDERPEPADAGASPVRPGGLALGPVQIHWYGLTYLVAFGLFLLAGGAARALAAGSPTPAGRGATSRTCCSTACSAWSSAGASATRCSTSRPTTWPTRWRSWRCGRAACPSTAACSACWRRWRCLRARRGRTLPAGDRPDRALRAHRAGLGAHRQLHQRRAVGPRGRPVAALGDGVSAVGQRPAAPPVAAVPVRARRAAAVRAAVVVCAASRGRPGRCRARSWSATACSASSPSTSASPTASSACCALDMSMGQWLCVPMIAAGVVAVAVGRPPARGSARCDRSSSTPRPPA